MNEIIREIEKEQLKEHVDSFRVGDTVRVHGKIKEGNRERIQVFEGTVLKIQGGSNRDLYGEKAFKRCRRRKDLADALSKRRESGSGKIR